jgi:sensor histidine kinase regulating citrate/malate metabolism
MNRKIRLIWDFRGPEAKQIAEHHAVHLREFSEKEQLPYVEAGVQQVSEMYSMAYIVVMEDKMITFRDALIPHRAEIAK